MPRARDAEKSARRSQPCSYLAGAVVLEPVEQVVGLSELGGSQ